MVKHVGAAAFKAARAGGVPRMVLVSGPDLGLVRRIADQCVAHLRLQNPDLDVRRFSEDDLRAEPARIGDAIAEASLFGGAALARVRVNGEREGAGLVVILDEAKARLPAGALVAEAGDLTRGSKLRKAFEDAGHAWSLQTYAASREDLARAARESAEAAGVKLQPDALGAVLETVAQETDSVAAEIDKLALYAGRGGVIDIAAVDALGSGGREAAVDDAVHAAFSGRRREALERLSQAFASGGAPVQALNATGRRIRLLLQLRVAVEAGTSPAQAVENPRLGIFWMRKADVATQAGQWSRNALEEALAATIATDGAVKRGGSPDEALVERLISRIAARGRG